MEENQSNRLMRAQSCPDVLDSPGEFRSQAHQSPTSSNSPSSSHTHTHQMGGLFSKSMGNVQSSTTSLPDKDGNGGYDAGTGSNGYNHINKNSISRKSGHRSREMSTSKQHSIMDVFNMHSIIEQLHLANPYSHGHGHGSSQFSGLEIGSIDLAVDGHNIAVLKQALECAHLTINYQSSLLDQQVQRVEQLESMMSSASGYGNDDSTYASNTSIKLSPDDKAASSRNGNPNCTASGGSTGNSPADSANCISSLGVINHRDLTRLAVRRRLISPLSVNVEHSQSPLESDSSTGDDARSSLSTVNAEAFHGQMHLQNGRQQYVGSSNARNSRHLPLDADDVASVSESYFSPSSFITPSAAAGAGLAPTSAVTLASGSHSNSNSAPSSAGSSDTSTVSRQRSHLQNSSVMNSNTATGPTAGAGGGASVIGNHSNSGRPRFFSAGSPVDEDLMNFNVRSSSNDDGDNDYSTVATTCSTVTIGVSDNLSTAAITSAPASAPPKGLAARLAMSANERRKINNGGGGGAGSRYRKSNLPSSLIQNGGAAAMHSVRSIAGSEVSDHSTIASESSPSSTTDAEAGGPPYPLASLSEPDMLLFSPHTPRGDREESGRRLMADNKLSHSASKLPIHVSSDVSANHRISPRPVSSFDTSRPRDQQKEASPHVSGSNSSSNGPLLGSAATPITLHGNYMPNGSLNSSSSSTSNNGNRPPPTVKRSIAGPLFQWRDRPYAYGRSGGQSDVYVFLAHDNPRLMCGYEDTSNGVSAVVKSMAGMEVMIETKNERGLACFVIATIVCNGSFDSVEDVNYGDQRGSAWIVCNKLWAVRAKLEEFPQRVRGEISEIDLQGVDQSCVVDVSDMHKVETFFAECPSKVDVILDPYRTSFWFPYYEGHRKMAPQFRSKGVGYLRLGDDMSQYGSAFMSLNAGHEYLDFGKMAVAKKIDEEKRAKLIAERKVKAAQKSRR